MQACGGARNTLAAEVSLPVTESSSRKPRDYGRARSGRCFLHQGATRRKPRELCPATILPLACALALRVLSFALLASSDLTPQEVAR